MIELSSLVSELDKSRRFLFKSVKKNRDPEARREVRLTIETQESQLNVYIEVQGEGEIIRDVVHITLLYQRASSALIQFPEPYEKLEIRFLETVVLRFANWELNVYLKYPAIQQWTTAKN